MVKLHRFFVGERGVFVLERKCEQVVGGQKPLRTDGGLPRSQVNAVGAVMFNLPYFVGVRRPKYDNVVA